MFREAEQCRRRLLPCQPTKVPAGLQMFEGLARRNFIFDSNFDYPLARTPAYPSTNLSIGNMGVAFDAAPDRPENIDAILNGLDRYNPETTGVFQEYVAQQCADQTYDAYANLALLKL